MAIQTTRKAYSDSQDQEVKRALSELREIHARLKFEGLATEAAAVHGARHSLADRLEIYGCPRPRDRVMD